MAVSLVRGLLEHGQDPAGICVATPRSARCHALASQFGIRAVQNNQEAAQGAETWILAVKPQVLQAVCTELRTCADAADVLVVSVAAGITAPLLRTWLGERATLVRAMPNTPVAVSTGVTGLFTASPITAGQKKRVTALFENLGYVFWLNDENLMDAVTAVSGSGPAYVFLLAEAIQQAAGALGLDAHTARESVRQTLLGAARMLCTAEEDAAALRQRVTSPHGTTHAALEIFRQGDFFGLTARAMQAACHRAGEMALELAQQTAHPVAASKAAALQNCEHKQNDTP